jgi:hypothetical protein
MKKGQWKKRLKKKKEKKRFKIILGCDDAQRMMKKIFEDKWFM